MVVGQAPVDVFTRQEAEARDVILIANAGKDTPAVQSGSSHRWV